MDSSLNRKKVILGLSGGVDSTAAALILQKQGYQVVGLYFNVLNCLCMNSEVNIAEGRKKAEKAAEQLGIDLIYRDMADSFDKTVINEFCREYMNGRTPNPCIICNPEIKFKTLIDAADEIGAYYIATGHYAGTYYDAKADKWFIKKAENQKKDQSYMLYRLGQDVISRLILPLNSYENKEEVRTLARSEGFENADTKDSQEICFIDQEDNYIDFMMRRGIVAEEGDFLDEKGNICGRHKGIASYTVGQRKGLGIALGYPVFVTAIDPETNTVKLGSNESLFKKTIKCTGNILCKHETEAYVKIRYAARPAKAKLSYEGELVTVEFDEPQRAPTPGQSAVFYVDDVVVGGGFIV